MALVALAKQGKIEEFKRATQSGADVNETDSEGQTSLHVASQKGNLEMVKILLAKKANVNAKDTNGWTPLHCAASTGQFKICEKLLQQKNIEITNNSDGATALFYVVRHTGQYDQVIYLHVLSLLLERGANLNARNNYGESPLHSACLKGNVDAVRFLVMNRADLTIVNRTGETSLHYAIRAGKAEFVRLLLEAGSNPATPSERGTPLEAANRYNNKEIIQMITDKLKNPGTTDRFKDALKAGYLNLHIKKTRWQRLFFIIKDNLCYYFKSDLEFDPLGSFDMSQTSFKDMPDKWEKFGCFKLEGNGKSILLSAGSESNRTSWMCALRAASAWRPVTEQVSVAPAQLSAKDLRELDEEKVKAELLSLTLLPGNRLCADCNQKDPLWVAIDLGVFLCAECAYIHQQNRVSSIKCIHSATDRWTSDHVNLLKAHGNIRVNALWEKNLPENFVWIQPEDPRDKKEAFIKSKYITKAYKSKEENRTVEDSALQYKMSRYAAVEFRQDYEAFLIQTLKQLSLTPRILSNIYASETYKQLAGIAAKYLGENTPFSYSMPVTEKTLPLALEKSVKYGYLATNTALSKGVLEAAKFIKESLANKSTNKETLSNHLSSLIKLYESHQAISQDIHLKLIFQWWFPQFVELLVILDNRNIVNDAVTATIAQLFLKNCPMMLYLLTGEYLYDAKIADLLTLTRKEDDMKKLFETIRDKSRNHAEAVRKDVILLQKENVELLIKSTRSAAPNATATEEEESQCETTASNGFYKLSDVENELETEIPLFKMWTRGPLLTSLFGFIRELPTETTKNLLKIERYAQNSAFAVIKDANQKQPSSFAVHSLENFILGRTQTIPFFDKLSALVNFLSTLPDWWSSTQEQRNTTEFKSSSRRLVFILNKIVKDLCSVSIPFSIPEVWSNWTNLLQIFNISIEFILICAELGLSRSSIAPVVNLLQTQTSWTLTQFANLLQADMSFFGVKIK